MLERPTLLPHRRKHNLAVSLERLGYIIEREATLPHRRKDKLAVRLERMVG